MSEELILQLIPERIRQSGYKNYHLRYRDFTIKASSTLVIPAFNEFWFISGDPQGLLVESGYGIYDSTGAYLSDNTHIHRGEIVITNEDPENKRIKFVQVIIIN